MSGDAERDQAEAESKPTMPDLEAVYDEKIYPLMAQILAVCKEHRMPMIACFQFSETGLCTSTISNPAADKRFPMAYQLLRNGYLAYTTTTRPAEPPAGAGS